MRQGQILFGLFLTIVLIAEGCGRSYETIRTREVSSETQSRPEITNPVPSKADSLQKIGERQFHTGKYLLASQTFYKVIVQSPDNWKARYYLGLIAVENGEFAVAEKWYEQSLAQVSYDAATRSMIYTSRAQMYELSGNQNRALLDYRTAANLDPQNQLASEALNRLNSSIGSATQPR